MIFEQFEELIMEVPVKSTINFGNNENCEYSNSLFSSKNCYMTFWGDFLELVLYSHSCSYCNNCVDLLSSYYCNNSYEIIDSNYVYNSMYVYSSSNITDSYYIANCVNCENCCFCVGLINKKFHFKNKPYSQDEYKKLVLEFISS